jgi:carbon monoxide dehydrogenase subunit G
MPRREARFAVQAPPQELWRFLRDFEALCTCIPGVEKISVIDERNAELTLREKLGVVPLIVALKASIESEEPPRRLHAVAKADHLVMDIQVALQQSGSGTELHSVFDVQGTGPLKAIVDRLFEKRATERTAQFAECLAQRFSGIAAPAETKRTAGALRRLLAWFGRLFSRCGSPSS